jgi:hypothetical protein
MRKKGSIANIIDDDKENINGKITIGYPEPVYRMQQVHLCMLRRKGRDVHSIKGQDKNQ